MGLREITSIIGTQDGDHVLYDKSFSSSVTTDSNKLRGLKKEINYSRLVTKLKYYKLRYINNVTKL